MEPGLTVTFAAYLSHRNKRAGSTLRFLCETQEFRSRAERGRAPALGPQAIEECCDGGQAIRHRVTQALAFSAIVATSASSYVQSARPVAHPEVPALDGVEAGDSPREDATPSRTEGPGSPLAASALSA
jgi:hypothetical protein